MNVYKITIEPVSNFGTPLKGDTLFGHICWQIYYNEKVFGKSLADILKDYNSDPVMVISSAYPQIKNTIFFNRPDLPISDLLDLRSKDKREIIKERKNLKKKRWMAVDVNSKISFKSQKYLSDSEVVMNIVEEKFDRDDRCSDRIIREFIQPHNTINRITGTTGENQFAPFSVEQFSYLKGMTLCVFVAIRDGMNIDGIFEIIKKIGKIGYGKDSSTGLGRFDVKGYEKFDMKSIGSENPNACYILSPCVPDKDAFKQVYFKPFTRFGRHGDVLAKSSRPFKNPVIMADEGAVFVVKSPDVFNKPYIGTAITGISKAEPKSVMQGYSIYIPVRVEA